MPRTNHTLAQAMDKLRSKSAPGSLKGMARFGIDITNTLGVSMPNIRGIGKEITKDHELAQELWKSGINEAKILASLVDHPKWVTSKQMDDWAGEFNSWDVCDQVCGNLFDKTPLIDEKIEDWRNDKREFVRRAAFAMIAWRAVHDKKSEDEIFLSYLPFIEEASDDYRNFVRKAVNWALRQIGKRSSSLHAPALALSKKLAESNDKSKRWIGKDAFKELDGEIIRRRLGV